MDENFVIHEHVFFSASGLRLEGILSYRDDVVCGQKLLLLPPHPHFAGDMNNNVMRAAAAGVAESGRVVLRFNYHGVEGSEPPRLKDESVIDYWRRVEEERDYERAVGDALAAYAFLSGAPPREVSACFVAGYSFGALVAALAQTRLPDLGGLVLLSAPLGKIDLACLQPAACPALLLGGDNDFLHDEAALALARERLGERATTEVLSGSDHFFRNEEQLPTRRLVEFLECHAGAAT